MPVTLSTAEHHQTGTSATLVQMDDGLLVLHVSYHDDDKGLIVQELVLPPNIMTPVFGMMLDACIAHTTRLLDERAIALGLVSDDTN